LLNGGWVVQIAEQESLNPEISSNVSKYTLIFPINTGLATVFSQALEF